MIIVDDKLSLDVLGGRLDVERPAATTWGFHYRLVRALHDETHRGSLGRSVTAEALRIAADPPESILRVLDPRVLTASAAGLAVRHGLNLLAAELVAASVRYRAEIYLSAPNVGRRWRDAMTAEGISLKVL